MSTRFRRFSEKPTGIARRLGRYQVLDSGYRRFQKVFQEVFVIFQQLERNIKAFHNDSSSSEGLSREF